MPDEAGLFRISGPTWTERANLGELKAVLAPFGSNRRNLFLDAVHRFGATAALRSIPQPAVVLDFGCGTGRFVRFFGSKGLTVVGLDITRAMLDAARRLGLPRRSGLMQTDGIRIPFRDHSVDGIWCCGVLRFSLFVPNPAYRLIAAEMHRVLKPGGTVANVEMYVDSPPEVFTKDFNAVGFRTQRVRVLQRYGGFLENFCQRDGLPEKLVPAAATLCAAIRYLTDQPYKQRPGLRDYFFEWKKEEAS